MAWMIVALAALASPPSTSTPAPPSAAAKPLSLQASFNAASQAMVDGRDEEALAGFTAIEGRPAVVRNPAVAGAVKARKASALFGLARLDEARDTARAALDQLPNQPASAEDRVTANLVLSRIAERRLDYPQARVHAEAALAAAAGTPDREIAALTMAVRASMFDPGRDALAYADRLVAAVSAQPGVKSRDTADARTLHARVLLNHGGVPQAYAELKRVLADRGGLGLKVSLSDVIMRSDLAIAALLAHDPANARKYLAYTGAGRLNGSPFARAASIDLPPCDPAVGLAPDDVAVVEFAIDANGVVLGASPIYASRNGPTAVAFAEAVAGWSWKPEDVAKIPPFFRATTRVELRCTNAAQRPSPVAGLKSTLAEWLDARGVARVEIDKPDAAALPLLRAELARREASPDQLALVPVLIEIGRNDVTPPKERVAALSRAGALLAANGAPVAARAAAMIFAAANDADISGSQLRLRYRAILADPAIAADAASAATLKLMIADPAYRLGPPADAGVLLREVVDDKRLPADDGLRVGALIRLANLQAAAGLIADARQSYAATGLDAQQCSLVDARPALKSGGAGSGDFPQEALRWGFEGWVKTEFDIAADGRTLNQRSVIAYPPFVFRDAGVGIAKSLRYRQTYRPDSGLGCTGQDINVNFVLP